MFDYERSHRLADDEIIALLKAMVESCGIGVYPYTNFDGPDSYNCPACGKFKKIRGHARHPQHIDEGEHLHDCNAVKLAGMLAADEPGLQEAIIHLVEQMIFAEEIGVYLVLLSNGKSIYKCQACDGVEVVENAKRGTRHLTDGDHTEGCNAMKLYYAVQNHGCDWIPLAGAED